MKKSPEATEKRTLAVLDEIMRRDVVRARIDATLERLGRRLLAVPGAQMAWETIPLSSYEPGLPGGIRSSWVFILRSGAVTGAERHPNSVQRTLSWRGEGDLQTLHDGRWTSHRLVSHGRAGLLERWVTIPAGTWHQVVVPGGHWVVLSFHTVPAGELIEERPRPDVPGRSQRRLYIGESAR
jgi:hypothetical protein